MTTPGWVQEPMMLSASTHDRAAHLRLDAAALAAAWADPRARVIRVHQGLAAFVEDRAELAYLTPDQVDAAAPRYFLGLDQDSAPFFAIDAPWEPGPGERAVGLRDISSSLGPTAAGLYVHALGLANWHVKHRFCANCGSPTQITAAGHVRQCPACGAQHFPRYDPAVIMLVVDDDDRALFGHNPVWPPGRFSTLAGFVEPGESLEAAVIREVYEEVGVVVDDVSYQGSQPWPFPSSLMLGFIAHTADPTLRIDSDEITEARWFSRDELVAAGKAREVLMPGSISIARWLVERWFGKPLPADNHW